MLASMSATNNAMLEDHLRAGVSAPNIIMNIRKNSVNTKPTPVIT